MVRKKAPIDRELTRPWSDDELISYRGFRLAYRYDGRGVVVVFPGGGARPFVELGVARFVKPRKWRNVS